MRSSTRTYELTDLQKQIWYGCLRFEDPGAYTLSVCVRITDVDPTAVRAAVERVLLADRLLALRVVGSVEEPVLGAVEDPGRGHRFRDMREASPEETEALIQERRTIALDPELATFDSLLVQTGESHLLWFLALHHLVADGWCVKVLVERVARLCEKGTSLSPGETDWEGYLAGWRSYRKSAAYTTDEQYWNERLRSPYRALEFYGRRAANETRTVRTAVDLDAETSRRIRRAAASGSGAASPPMVALANFFASVLFTYLYKMSGERLLSIGAPFSNRRSAEARSSLGLRMQIAILRVQVDEHASFRTLLEQVRNESDNANRHIRLTPASSENRHYEAMVNVHNVSYPRIAGGEVREEWLRSGNDTIPLTLHVRNTDAKRIRLEVDLQEELFPSELRARVVRHFLRVLDQAATDPGRPILDFELEEASALLPSPNPVGLPKGLTLHGLFRQQAVAMGERTAVIADGASSSFAEIDSRSDEIRVCLASLGCTKGSIIGIRMERSIGAVASILGILKAGGIWLPLDLSYPLGLLSFMASDSGARVIIEAPDLPALTGPASAIQTLVVRSRSGRVGSNDTERRGAPVESPPPVPQSGSWPAAFCLYTSGSTGRPKGVIGSHGAAINRLRWMWRTHPFDEDEVVLQKTSLNFIDSVWEIFGALLAGRSVLIASEETVRDPRGLSELARRHPIRRIILVPTLLRSYLAASGGFPPELSRIRRWFVTGELFSTNLARAFLESHPDAELYNLYGTTETYDAACHRVKAADLERPFVPIGRPIDNMQLLVLDKRLRPVPEGVRGELYVRGVGVAAGYLNRPELTASKFPTVDGAGSSPLFRSGDSARALPRGEVELLGRLDNQVKLHGYRIELEEVEHHLLAIPGVAGALAAVDGSHDAADARLVAYITREKGARLRAPELHGLLRERLPPWMIPSFRIVESLPKTPSGKRARDATTLEVNGRHSSRRLSGLRIPWTRDPLESRLRAIWRRVLDAKQVGDHDNFFDLGGNSLLAVRAAAEIERELGIRLPLASLFEAPTIRQLIDRHIRGSSASAPSPVAVRRGAASRTPLFSVPPAGSTVSVFSALARYLPQDQPLYSFQPKGLERGENPHLSIEEMARDYLRELRAIQPEGPYLLSGRCFGGYVAYEMAQELAEAGERVAALIIIDSPEAPLEAAQQRTHVGVQKLFRYYPKRIHYFVRRRRLAYTVRMKIRNDFSYLVARLLDRIPLPALDSRERRLRMLRHLHTLAYHRYIAKPYDGRITMLSAGETVNLTDERRTWQRLSRGGIDWHTIPGRHHDLMKEPNIRRVAEKITECLEDVDVVAKGLTQP